MTEHARGSSSSLWDSQKEHQDLLIMSRRSLRLDEGLLDWSLPHSSASFSVGGASWRSNRSLKCRRSQHLSASCSESLLLTSPRRATSLLSSSLHSVASDASLLSSLLDESSVQESTLVDTFWGLDQDLDPKESTIVADQSSLDPDSRCPKHLVQTLSRVPCKDCEHQSVSTNCSSSKYTSSSEPEASTIYCRDRSHRSKTDVLQLWFLSSVLCVRRAAAGCASVLTHTWQVCQDLFSQTDNTHAARSGLCGVMDLKESTTTQKELHPYGSLSDVYKRLNRQWRHMTSSFLLTGFPLLLLVVLLPLLLLFFSLCWFGPAALRSVLPAVDVTERGTLVSGLSAVSGFLSFQSRPAEGAVEERREVQPPAAGEEDGSVRLVRLEESLAVLWGHVEAGGQRADQRHQELLQLYADLQQPVSDQRHGEEEQPWMMDLLDQKLDQLSRGLDEDRRQTEKQDSFQQQSETSRLDLLELQLQTLAARTEVQSYMNAGPPSLMNAGPPSLMNPPAPRLL
ncbi:uncharacterized protein LOC116401477 [Anarrhichthys ocellatus]|uniref:uncharacterized protein LOC116401477 n=1 Tax=Anarrhichthys ocellatus TaxID=433405 RepID=UPI0012EE4002|nr:uncharacterized protein LOC116401477 [Anarrhichthys ocellatus]